MPFLPIIRALLESVETKSKRTKSILSAFTCIKFAGCEIGEVQNV